MGSVWANRGLLWGWAGIPGAGVTLYGLFLPPPDKGRPSPFLFLSGPLPVARPLAGLARRHSRARNQRGLLAVRDAAVIFAPCHLIRIGIQIRAGDVVVRSDLRRGEGG